MTKSFNQSINEQGTSAVITLLKRSGLDSQLDQLFPANKRTPENIKNSLVSAQLPDIVTYLTSQVLVHLLALRGV